MYINKLKMLKASAIFGLFVLLTSCANTKISQSWVEPDNKKSYNDLLIIGISESEQDRRAYESNFVEVLRSHGVEGEASYKIINSKEKINRDTVVNAIKGMNIDTQPHFSPVRSSAARLGAPP